MRRNAGRLCWAVGLVALAYAARILFPVGQSELTRKSPDELSEMMQADLQVLSTLNQNMTAILDGVTTEPFLQRKGDYRSNAERDRAPGTLGALHRSCLRVGGCPETLPDVLPFALRLAAKASCKGVLPGLRRLRR